MQCCPGSHFTVAARRSSAAAHKARPRRSVRLHHSGGTQRSSQARARCKRLGAKQSLTVVDSWTRQRVAATATGAGAVLASPRRSTFWVSYDARTFG